MGLLRTVKLERPPLEEDAINYYTEGINVVKASEDKQFPGAIAAGLGSPWGQAVPAGNFETAARRRTSVPTARCSASDLYEAFTALLVAGDTDTAQDATRFLFCASSNPTAGCHATGCPTARSRRTPGASSSTRRRTRS